MKTLALTLVCCVIGTFPATAGEAETEITKMDMKSLDFELPPYIQVRSDMAAMQRPEFLESTKKLGFGPKIQDSRSDPSSSVRVYKAWDGVVFLEDHYNMSLWVRANNEWKCVVANLRIEKTMGGARRFLPARYLGSGYFAVSETLPGEVAEKSERGFPQARAATFLIDSKDGKVKERSEAFIYDHNPPVKVPESWITLYKLKSNQGEDEKTSNR